MTTATTDRLIPTGTYTVDTVHSNANFEVEHSGVSVFRGGFKPVDAKLVSNDTGVSLEGRVSVDAISIDDENIRPHVLSPDFFDAERNPEITFKSTEITGAPDDVRVTGELAMAGATVQVAATGRLRGPLESAGGLTKLALSLEATIDRTAYGMNWQMEMPGGDPILGNDVRLLVDLEFNVEA
jgi:polyisoprenoid-binding protein YceI